MVRKRSPKERTCRKELDEKVQWCAECACACHVFFEKQYPVQPRHLDVPYFHQVLVRDLALALGLV